MSFSVPSYNNNTVKDTSAGRNSVSLPQSLAEKSRLENDEEMDVDMSESSFKVNGPGMSKAHKTTEQSTSFNPEAHSNSHSAVSGLPGKN